MNYINFSSYLLAFALAFGILFIAQCERDTETDTSDLQQEQEDIGIDREDRRYDGTDDEHQALSLHFEDDRDELAANIEELRDSLDVELDNRPETTDDESERMFEQMQNDRDELDRILGEVEATSEEEWENIRPEAEETYDRISSRYEDRNPLDEYPDRETGVPDQE